MTTATPGILRARLSHNVARLRRLHGWTQIELAVEAGIGRTYVTDIERKSRNVTVDNIDRLARAFKIDPIELLLPAATEAAPKPDGL